MDEFSTLLSVCEKAFHAYVLQMKTEEPKKFDYINFTRKHYSTDLAKCRPECEYEAIGNKFHGLKKRLPIQKKENDTDLNQLEFAGFRLPANLTLSAPDKEKDEPYYKSTWVCTVPEMRLHIALRKAHSDAVMKEAKELERLCDLAESIPKYGYWWTWKRIVEEARKHGIENCNISNVG